MRAHPRGAADDSALDHLLAAGIDILDGEIALHRGNRLDRLAKAAMAVAAAAEQAGLVEMDVGVDKAGQHQPAGGIDLGRLADKFWRDRGDLATGNPDIDGRGRRRGLRHCEKRDRRRSWLASDWATQGTEPALSVITT